MCQWDNVIVQCPEIFDVPPMLKKLGTAYHLYVGPCTVCVLWLYLGIIAFCDAHSKNTKYYRELYMLEFWQAFHRISQKWSSHSLRNLAKLKMSHKTFHKVRNILTLLLVVAKLVKKNPTLESDSVNY